MCPIVFVLIKEILTPDTYEMSIKKMLILNEMYIFKWLFIMHMWKF